MNIRGISLILLAFITIHCGSETIDPQKTDESLNSRIPDARSLGLSKDNNSLGLQGESQKKCEEYSNMGVFGIPLGLACHTAPLVGEILYGKSPDQDHDGELTCSDYDPEKEQGILFALLCNEGIRSQPGIKSMRFREENNQEIAISFEDIDANDEFESTGEWNATYAESEKFPTDIRLWLANQNSEYELEGVLAMQIKDYDSGRIFFDFSRFQDDSLLGEMNFDIKDVATDCESAPSQENCHFQDISIKGGENSGTGMAPAGARLRIFSNAKVSPNFFALEGHIRISERAALESWQNSEAVANGLTDLLEIREIYFRTVRLGDELWGSFHFKNGSNESLSLRVNLENGQQLDFGTILRDGLANQSYSGICQSAKQDQTKACSIIDYTNYDELWLGEELLKAPGPDYQFTIDMSPIPEVGLTL